MSAPRQGLFIRRDARIGKIAFSAELAERLGMFVYVDYDGPVSLTRCLSINMGEPDPARSVHRIGHYVKGIVHRKLWDLLPEGRTAVVARDGYFEVQLD